MRFFALLLLPALTFAAPALKEAEKTDLEVTLAAKSLDVLEVTIKNGGKEPLELPYRVTPHEYLAVELRGAKGKKYTIERTKEDNEVQATPGTVTIPPGETTTLTVHTCHYLLEVGEPGEAITFTARFTHKGKTSVSKALTVDPVGRKR